MIAVVLWIVVIGFFIFLYMLVVKPWGSLTVTYARSELIASTATPKAEGATLASRLAQLDDARKAGLISDEEHVARRAQIIDEA